MDTNIQENYISLEETAVYWVLNQLRCEAG